LWRAAAAAGFSLLMAQAPGAEAASLNLDKGFPDVFGAAVSVSYNATTDVLTVSGEPLSYSPNSSTSVTIDTPRSLSITANISGTGSLGGGSNTVSILGKIPSLGANSGTLLTGNLTQFGFPGGAGDPLEFLFDITGGDLAAAYQAAGVPVGIIISGTSFPGSFQSDFANNGLGVVDVAAVPIPASAWLMGSALVGLFGFARRRAAAA
jgi:hypothetical protein